MTSEPWQHQVEILIHIFRQKELDISKLQLPRRRGPPKCLDGGQSLYFPETVEEYFRVKYFEEEESRNDLITLGMKFIVILRTCSPKQFLEVISLMSYPPFATFRVQI